MLPVRRTIARLISGGPAQEHRQMPSRLTLADLGIEPDDDAGTTWHPRQEKTEARDADGNLRNLSDPEVDEHAEKPEADEQPDGIRRRRRERRAALAAEDSIDSEPGEV